MRHGYGGHHNWCESHRGCHLQHNSNRDLFIEYQCINTKFDHCLGCIHDNVFVIIFHEIWWCMINHLTPNSSMMVVQGKPYKQSREDTLLIQHTRPRGGRPSKKGLDDLFTFQGRLSHTSLGRARYSARNIMIKVPLP